MSLEINKIATKKTGDLYNILENNESVKIKLTNIKTLFKPDKYYNNFYIKWNIENKDIRKIEIIEQILQQTFSKNIKSNILTLNNYPKLLNTKFIYSKNNPIIIENSLMSVPDFLEHNLERSYNILIEIGKVFINDEIKYPLIIKTINVC